MIVLVTGHFVYWTFRLYKSLRLRDSSPIRHKRREVKLLLLRICLWCFQGSVT